jgi:hypothetical protein
MQQDWRKSHFGLLSLLAVLLILGTLFQTYRFNQSIADGRRTLATVEREIGAVLVALADYRAAQAGYVATGQGPEFWMRRAGELASRIEGRLTQLRDASSDAATRGSYETAIGALANLASLDKRARDHVVNDQRFLAADVIFVESLEATHRLAGDLEAMRAVAIATAEASLERLAWFQLGLIALAMAIVGAGGLYLGRPGPVSAASEAAQTAQMIRDLPPPVRPATPLTRPGPAPSPPPPAPAVNLPDAAELCVDLARVIDGRDVPALLERAARVLDAKGIILWMVDGTGATLRPSLSHGYTDKVLSRLGTLDVDADNVTSLAFRSVRPQVMPAAAPGAAGAVAVPLVTAAGCNGVLAAEIREAKPAPEVLALTRIVAAQFATLIGPADYPAARVAEA